VEDLEDLPDGSLGIVVENEVVVEVGYLKLLSGPIESFPDALGIFRVSVFQTPSEFFQGGGEQEDVHSWNALCSKLSHSLGIQSQEQVAIVVSLKGFFDGVARGAVALSCVRCMLEELSATEFFFKGFLAEEVVIHAILLSRPWLSGCCRHPAVDLRMFAEKAGDEAFSNARGSGENEKASHAVSPYSMFWICSFISSTFAFI